MAETRVVIAADEPLCGRLSTGLRTAGFEVETCETAEALLVTLLVAPADFALMEWQVVSRSLDDLEEAFGLARGTHVFALLREEHLDAGPRLKAAGVAGVFTAPFQVPELIERMRRQAGNAARAGRRLSTAIPAVLSAGGHIIHGRTADVSPRGLGITVDRSLPLQTDVKVLLVGLHQPPLEVSGVVVSERMSEGSPRLGIRLRDLSEDELTRLRALTHTDDREGARLTMRPTMGRGKPVLSSPVPEPSAEGDAALQEPVPPRT